MTTATTAISTQEKIQEMVRRIVAQFHPEQKLFFSVRMRVTKLDRIATSIS
jgi:hypothetical protein